MTVQVSINGKSWRFLIDIGSQVTVLCGKCALDNQRFVKGDSLRPTFRGVGGNAIKSAGEAKIKFKLGNQDFTYSFMMVPDEFFGSQIDGVLGANFVEENGAVIKFEKKESGELSE